MQRKFILLFAGLLLALNFFAWQEVFVLNQPHYLKVYFLSVGQGDAELIETPQGHYILIDGGPNSLVLQKLNEYLPFWDKTIDVVILTHPEKDHMTGLLDVLQRYKVDYFMWTGVVKNDAENKKLAELLKEKSILSRQNILAGFLPRGKKPDESIKVITLSAEKEIIAGNVLIDVLSPLEKMEGLQPKDVNNTSLVARLEYGNRSFLFTGDIDSKTEKKLAELYELKADILKVAHHGSKYSTSDLFLNEVRPEYAVIEVGKNSYGHPTPETLNRLENFGIQIKRTDKDGDVQFLSDGNVIQIK